VYTPLPNCRGQACEPPWGVRSRTRRIFPTFHHHGAACSRIGDYYPRDRTPVEAGKRCITGVRRAGGTLIPVLEQTTGIGAPFVSYNPLVLEGMTPLQVLHHRFGMMTLMLAPPAGVENVSLFQAEHKPGLLPRALRQCGHFFLPKVTDALSQTAHKLEGCLSMGQSSCHGIYSRRLEKGAGRLPRPGLDRRLGVHSSLDHDSGCRS
jgi:hypothetical protein